MWWVVVETMSRVEFYFEDEGREKKVEEYIDTLRDEVTNFRALFRFLTELKGMQSTRPIDLTKGDTKFWDAHDDEFEKFFRKTFPFILDCILMTKVTFAEPLAPLRVPFWDPEEGVETSFAQLSMTRFHALIIMCNAFCSLFDRNVSVPGINFSDQGFFQALDVANRALRVEKLKCLAAYFDYWRKLFERGNVDDLVHESSREIRFSRGYRSLEEVVPDLANYRVQVKIAHTGEKGVTVGMEEWPLYMEQSTTPGIPTKYHVTEIDFANAWIGGGVLGGGAVQEEIKFLQTPESIITRLFIPKMGDGEAVQIDGARVYCATKGYGRGGLKFVGGVDEDAGTMRRVVAMDALDFRGNLEYVRGENGKLIKNPKSSAEFKSKSQWFKWNVDREIAKAMSAFDVEQDVEEDRPIITGNWGTGAFGGDLELKFLIQIVAGSLVESEGLYYFPFDYDSYQKVREVLFGLPQTSGKAAYERIRVLAQRNLKGFAKTGWEKRGAPSEFFSV